MGESSSSAPPNSISHVESVLTLRCQKNSCPINFRFSNARCSKNRASAESWYGSYLSTYASNRRTSDWFCSRFHCREP